MPSRAGEHLLARDRRAWALAPAHLLIVLVVGAFYLLLSYVPLGGPALWGTLNYGDWILEHRSLPTEDPLLPLAEGMMLVDTEWLSQLILSALNSAGGVWLLSQLFALTAAVTLALLAHVFFLSTGSRFLSLAGTLSVILLGWSGWTDQAPERLGLLCFAVLLWLIADRVTGSPESGRGHSLRLWIGIPTLFVAWTNLHGSFIYGLGLLVCFLLGRVIEVGWRTKSIEALASDPATRRWLYRLELACAATVFNPHGLDVLVYAPWFGPPVPLQMLPSWQPMMLQSPGGWMFAGSLAAVVVALWVNRRPLPVTLGLSLTVFACAAARWAGMVNWYAPVFALVVLPLLVRRPAGSTAKPTQATIAAFGRAFLTRSWHSSLVAAVLLWSIFALSPIGGVLFQREPRPRDQLLAPDTPIALAAFLEANPPAGQVFNPWWWGDWLVQEGPSRVQPFATSRLEVLPARVLQDYHRIEAAAPGWPLVLERYGIRTVVIDKSRQSLQWESMQDSPEWRWSYQDELAAVLVATTPAHVASAGQRP